MISSDIPFLEQALPPDAEKPSDTLFQGDTGNLHLDIRRALVQLLSGPSLEERRHPKLWPVLIRDEPVIRSRLSELFLELVLDKESRVAFTRQADAGELEVPILLRRAPLTFMDSVVLLRLRHLLTQADAQGQRAVVSIDEMVEYLSLYENSANTDHSGFVNRITSSIKKIKQHNILHKIRGSEDRFEISPTLKLLFSAEEIRALTGKFKEMANTTTQEPASGDPEPLEEEKA